MIIAHTHIVCTVQSGKVKLEKVQITLNDCLACSGCITSAESVLVTQQSQEELFKVLHRNKNGREVGTKISLSYYGCLVLCYYLVKQHRGYKNSGCLNFPTINCIHSRLV